MIHGPHCNTKAFPLNCRYCGQRIFFFRCDHDSRVLFDHLGPPWPLHDCLNQGTTSGTGSPSVLPSILGINIYRGSRHQTGLLPGLRHERQSIDPKVSRRVTRSKNLARETIRIEPLGSVGVEIVGVVQTRSQPDLAKRYGVARGSIGFGEFAKSVGDSDPVQLTMLVDELADDPAAIDYSSYTFLCPRKMIDNAVRKGAVIGVRLQQAEVLGGGEVWLALAVEVLF